MTLAELSEDDQLEYWNRVETHARAQRYRLRERQALRALLQVTEPDETVRERIVSVHMQRDLDAELPRPGRPRTE